MALRDVTLEDKYTATAGRLVMTGTQALVRLPLLQKALGHDATYAALLLLGWSATSVVWCELETIRQGNVAGPSSRGASRWSSVVTV